MEVIYHQRPGNIESIVNSVDEHKPGTPIYHYGTAGFRDKGESLTSVAPRIGLIAALRSLSVKNRPVGIMITASHNHVDDNGFKIIDPSGGMLAMSWEAVATDVTNAGKDTLGALLQKNLNENKTQLPVPEPDLPAELVKITDPANHHFGIFTSMPTRPVVLMGYDTRPTSLLLFSKISAACLQMGAIVVNYGLATTPQLHWAVGHMNDLWHVEAESGVKFLTQIDDYTKTVAKAFVELHNLFDHFSLLKDKGVPPPLEKSDHVFVDVAYGVGEYAFGPVAEYIQKDSSTDSKLPIIKTILTPKDGQSVNSAAGIDYALKNRGSGLNQKLLDVLQQASKDPSNLLFSVDGDCDRIGGIVPGKGPEDKPRFLDGDRLLVLFTQFLSTLVDFYDLSKEIEISIVQTAYCNGASTHFLKQNYPNVKLFKACTGVKYLLEKTKETDLSVYFEQNGHGSVHFNKSLFTKLDKLEKSSDATIASNAKEFRNLMNLCRDVITPYIGDACGDLLFTLLALRALRMTMISSYETYTDLFCSLHVVAIPDKNKIKPDRALFEERLLEPVQLQNDIDALMKKYDGFQPRAFIRPSGTENVVRTFAESTCPKKTEEIADALKDLVVKHSK